MFCEIYITDVPYHLDRPFDYYCSDNLSVGRVVKVPFGKADKLRVGVITGIKDAAPGENIKPVHSYLDERLTLTEQMLGLCFFLKESLELAIKQYNI